MYAYRRRRRYLRYQLNRYKGVQLSTIKSDSESFASSTKWNRVFKSNQFFNASKLKTSNITELKLFKSSTFHTKSAVDEVIELTTLGRHQ